jgi:hypothetical protein
MTVMAVEKSIPLAGLPAHVVFQKDRIRRFVWFFAQGHISFFRRALSFFRIAPFARGNQVDPGVATTAGTRCDVIDREVLPGAAILALVVIAFKYILPGKINALVRGVHISVQADDRGHRKTLRHRMQFEPIGGSYHFTFVQKNQNERALDRAHHQWTIVLIEHQHPAVHK